MADIAVFHLVRRGNPLSGLERFLDSYRTHNAGLPHDLVIVLKGFKAEAELSATRRALADVVHTTIRVPDPGFDISAYFAAARSRDHGYLMFLNSFSEILVGDWLRLFSEAVRRDGVGIAGATGSWQSIHSDYVHRQAHPRRTLIDHAKGVARHFWHWRTPEDFPEFPNYHLRTNAFMLRGDLMRSLDAPRIRTKRDAYRFESGYRGMTRQVLARGLDCVVVGRDGGVYSPRDWKDSRTFWIGDQENLAVADNQTRNYERGDEGLRRRLSFHAWRSPSTYDWSEWARR